MDVRKRAMCMSAPSAAGLFLFLRKLAHPVGWILRIFAIGRRRRSGSNPAHFCFLFFMTATAQGMRPSAREIVTSGYPASRKNRL